MLPDLPGTAELFGEAAILLDPTDEAGRKAIEDEVAKRDQEADAYNARLAVLRGQVARSLPLLERLGVPIRALDGGPLAPVAA